MSRQFVSFGLGDNVYGLDILMTESIEKNVNITGSQASKICSWGNQRRGYYSVISLRNRPGIGRQNRVVV